MAAAPRARRLTIRVLLPALWLLHLLTLVVWHLDAMLQEGPGGSLGGAPRMAEILLSGAILIPLPVAMVPLSLLLRREWLRWTSVACATLALALAGLSRPGDVADILFATIGVVALIAIIAIAWRMPAEAAVRGEAEARAV